jgi:hypothetical protein
MAQRKDKTMMFAWVDSAVVRIVEKLIAMNGISKSEYLRQLIIQDLDRRSIFTMKLKERLIAQKED